MRIWQVPFTVPELVVFTCQSLRIDNSSRLAAHSPLVTLTFLGMALVRQILDPMSTFETSKLRQDIWCYVWDTWSSNASCLTARHVAPCDPRAMRVDQCQRNAAGILRFGLRPLHGTSRSVCICTSAARALNRAPPLNQCHAKLPLSASPLNRCET